jgi:putative endonuclease
MVAHGGANYPPKVNSPEKEDWKKRLKELGITRKRKKRPKKDEDFLRKEEGKRPGGAPGSRSSEAPAAIHPLEEGPLRTSHEPQGGRPGEATGSHGAEVPASPLSLEAGSPRTLQKVLSGRIGEDIACALLAENSLQVLARNVRYPDGEIDIVALDGATTVFVEVKRRKNDARGTPAEAVTPRKRNRVIRAARRWLVENPGRSRSVRFDVVAIREEPPEVTWIRGAFDTSGT